MKPLPLSSYAEETIGNDGRRVYTLLSYPKYHRHADGQLHETDCFVRECQHPGWDWEVTEGTWILHVKWDGTYQSLFYGHTLTRKPLGLGFYNASTKEYVVKISFDLHQWAASVHGDTVSWTNPEGGTTYRVTYVQDQAHAIAEVPQSVQEQLSQELPPWAPEDTYVGIIYDANLDFLSDEDIDTEGRIVYTEEDRVIKVGSLLVNHEKSSQAESLEELAQLTWPKHTIYLPTSGKYIEACSLEALESTPGSLIFNDTDTFQEGTDGYTGCEDAYMWEQDPDTNWGGPVFFVTDYIPNVVRSLIKFDLSGEIPIVPHQTISSASLSLYLDSLLHGGVGYLTAHCYGVLKPWVESEVTWNQWQTTGEDFWHAAGCDEANDYAYFNSFNGYGYDRTASYTYQYYAPYDVGGFEAINLTTWQFQKQYDDQCWYGWVLAPIRPNPNPYEDASAGFRSSEHPTVVTRPYLTVTFDPTSSSLSSASSSYSSMSSSCSSWVPTAHSCEFGQQTLLQNLQFETAHEDGIQLGRYSVAHNSYAHQASGIDYPAWNIMGDTYASTSLISCEGVSSAGIAFYISPGVYLTIRNVHITGCLAHDSRVGIHTRRFATISRNLIYNCDIGIGMAGTGANMENLIRENTIYSCNWGIHAAVSGAGLYILGNIIDSCAYGIYGTSRNQACYLDWNNFSNIAIEDIALVGGTPIMNKGPHTTLFDPGFFDVGSLDFRIGQHMRGLGIASSFGSDGSVDSGSIGWPDQGAVQRRETIGVDAAVRATGPDAHSGTGYALVSPTSLSKYPLEWEFLAPVKANRRLQFSFWRKGVFTGTFRFYATGPGVLMNEPVAVPGSYQQHISAVATPTADSFVKVKFYAYGTGNIYIDDFATSQSSSFSSSSSSSSFSSCSSSFSSSSSCSSSFSSSSSCSSSFSSSSSSFSSSCSSSSCSSSFSSSCSSSFSSSCSSSSCSSSFSSSCSSSFSSSSSCSSSFSSCSSSFSSCSSSSCSSSSA